MGLVLASWIIFPDGVRWRQESEFGDGELTALMMWIGVLEVTGGVSRAARMMRRLLPPQERKTFQEGHSSSDQEWEKAVESLCQRQMTGAGDHRKQPAPFVKGCLYFYGTQNVDYLGETELMRFKRKFRPGPILWSCEH